MASGSSSAAGPSSSYSQENQPIFGVCPACREKLKKSRVLPCGHCVCGPDSPKRCAIKVSGMSNPRCPVENCKYNKTKFRRKFTLEDLADGQPEMSSAAPPEYRSRPPLREPNLLRVNSRRFSTRMTYSSNQSRGECPSCGNKLTCSRVMPCGHYVCNKCAISICGKSNPRCPVDDCKYSKRDFRCKITHEDLADGQPGLSTDSPPDYQSRSSSRDGATQVSPIFITYSDICSKPNHIKSKLDLYCSKCEESICKKCWLTEHSDKNEHEIVPFALLLKPEKNIESRMKLYRTECLRMKNFERKYKSILNDIEKLQAKQKLVTEKFIVVDLKKMSNKVKNGAQKTVDTLTRLKDKIDTQFDKITEKHGQIFEDQRKQAVLEETSLIPKNIDENEISGCEDSDYEPPEIEFAECSLGQHKLQDSRKLPCGHLICGPNSSKRCAHFICARSEPRCPRTDCRNHTTQYSSNFSVSDLPVDSYNGLPAIQPPPYDSQFPIESQSDKFPVCKSHRGQRMEFYCTKTGCEIQICSECWTDKHSNHTNDVVPFENLLDSETVKFENISKFQKQSRKVLEIFSEYETIINDVDNAMNAQNSVTKSKVNEELRQLSQNATLMLGRQLNSINDVKTNMLDTFELLIESGRGIYNDCLQKYVDETTSTVTAGAVSSEINSENIGNVQTVDKNSGEKKIDEDRRHHPAKRLMGIDAEKLSGTMEIAGRMVYDSVNNQLISIAENKEVLKVYGLNLKSASIKLNRSLNLLKLREKTDAQAIFDLAIDSSSRVYACMLYSTDGAIDWRVEEVGLKTLKKKNTLDTTDILNGKGILRMLLSYNDTIAVLVYDHSKEGAVKWASVTVYSNQERQHTVSIDIIIEEDVYYQSYVMVNETTLLLSCGKNNRVVVVSLPTPKPREQQIHDSNQTKTQATKETGNLQPVYVKYITLCGVEILGKLIWIPSLLESEDQPSTNSLRGYLFATNEKADACKKLVYDIDLESLLSDVENSEETTIEPMSGVAPLEDIGALCVIDHSTILGATFGGIRLLNLNYSPPE